MNSIAYRLVLVALSVTCIAALPASAQTDGCETYTSAGLRALQSGDDNLAASFFTKAVFANPSSMTARRLLALAQLHEGCAQSALSIMQVVMKYERTADDLACLGDVYFALGRQDLAQQSYEEALQTAPLHAQCIAGMVNIYIASQQYDKAKELCQKALSKSTDQNLSANLAGKLSQIEQAQKIVSVGKLGA